MLAECLRNIRYCMWQVGAGVAIAGGFVYSVVDDMLKPKPKAKKQ